MHVPHHRGRAAAPVLLRRTARSALLALAMSACARDREVVAPDDMPATRTTSATPAATVAWPTVHVLEDTAPGSILNIHPAYPPPDARYVIDYVALVRRLEAVYGDISTVDFLVVLPTKPLITHTSFVANRHISGIGSCDACSFPDAPTLKNVVQLAFYQSWEAADTVGFDPMRFFTGFQNDLLHELGHYWLMGIENFGTSYPGHYQNTLDLFNGDSTYVDPLAYAHWIVRNRTTCVSQGSPGTTTRFSDLSLYLMGLIPPAQVAPVTQHVFAPIPGNDAYNAIGPRCGEPYKFIKKRIVKISDIVALHGVRTPASSVSQKYFNVMFVVVHPAGEPAPAGFVAYAGAFADALPTTWAAATRFRSGLKIFEAP